MSNCRITPVLVLVLVFSFMFGGCGRDMDLRELSQDQVPAVRMCPVRRSV